VKVRLTASAAADIEKIADGIAQADVERARVTVRALRAVARSIGGAAYLGSPVTWAPDVRKKAAHPYLLFYVISGGEAVILRIAHERSDRASLV